MDQIYLPTLSFDTEDFEKIEAYDGLLWIDYSIISINSSCCCPDTPEYMKMSDVMGLTKLDPSMLVFVS